MNESEFCDSVQVGFRSFPRDVLQAELAVSAGHTGLAFRAAIAQTPPHGILWKKKRIHENTHKSRGKLVSTSYTVPRNLTRAIIYSNT